MSYIGASTIIISLTVILAVLQERNAWQFLKAAMQSLAFFRNQLSCASIAASIFIKKKINIRGRSDRWHLFKLDTKPVHKEDSSHYLISCNL